MVLASPSDPTFLRRTPLFANLSEQALRAIHASGETLGCRPGQIIFHEGATGSDLFVVKSGVLEVRKNDRVVSYLSAGECFGEMSLLTGAPRSATIVVPERAELFRIPGVILERILTQNAEVALALARVLAHRLELANQLRLPASSSTIARHLAGDLKFFDVPEVCQTLMQSRRTGKLEIRREGTGDDVELWFDDGVIRHARFGSLQGTAAALSLLRTRLAGSFEFISSRGYEGPKGEPELEDGTMGLLLEAARQGDEIEAIKSQLPADHAFVRDDVTFVFEGELVSSNHEGALLRGEWRPRSEEERAFAREVWTALASPLGMDRYADQFRDRELLAWQVLHAMWRMGAVR